MKHNKVENLQHYVPQFLLKQFTSGKKSQVWVFDKATGKIFRTHVKNVASEKGFYNFKFRGYELTIEPSLADIETHAATIIKDIVGKNSISDISEDEKTFLSHFFALQFVRTKQHRQLFRDLAKTLDNSLRQIGKDKSKIKDYIEVDDKTLKIHGIRSVLKSEEYAPYFLHKSWVLFKTTKSHPLFISDNPVTLQNMIDHGPYGNIGLAVRGIEIYFPLSKTLTLGIFCQSHEENFRKNYEQYKLIMQIDPSLGSSMIKDNAFISQIMNGFEKKETVPYKIESVINHNSLQVFFASRFVFSSNDDFSLALKMIRDNPELKAGPKFVGS